MIAENLNTFETWGQRLADEARLIAERRIPAFRWLAALAPLVERITDMPTPYAERFRRIEPAAPQLRKTPPQPDVEFEAWQTEGEPLAARVRDQLRDLVGLRNEPMILHHNDHGDRVARSHRADAVTSDGHVYFRHGQLRPEEPRGLALLAHEATHIVEAIRPGASWRRATEAGLDEEERKAQSREQAVRTPSATLAELRMRMVRPIGLPPASNLPAVTRTAHSDTPLPPLSGTRQSFQPAPAAAPPAARSMKADIDRPMAEIPAHPVLNVDELRRSLYRDILNRMRTDAERGA
jgi:Domain of unknown function (DUF4157)